MRAGCGNLHYEVLHILLSSPDIISLIKSRMEGQGSRQCALKRWEIHKNVHCWKMWEKRVQDNYSIENCWGGDWDAWCRLHSKASQYSQFCRTSVSSQRVGYNAVDIYVNIVRLTRTFAYAFWPLRDFSGQFQDIASNLFRKSYFIYYAIFYNAKSDKNASIAL
jgi:hypothetical protein